MFQNDHITLSFYHIDMINIILMYFQNEEEDLEAIPTVLK